MRLLQESGLPGGQQIGAEGLPAAHLGWGLGTGQDLQDELGLELGGEAAAFLHAGASPFGPPGSLCTCPIRGAHYTFPPRGAQRLSASQRSAQGSTRCNKRRWLMGPDP